MSNEKMSINEFMYQLKNVVPSEQRKQWANENKHRIEYIKAPSTKEILDSLENSTGHEYVVIQRGAAMGKTDSIFGDIMNYIDLPTPELIEPKSTSIGVIGNLPRGIHITSANGVVVMPEDSTADEINTVVKNEMRKIQAPKPIKFELHAPPLLAELPDGSKSFYKKHKPNTGFTLGSYKYKSKRK